MNEDGIRDDEFARYQDYYRNNCRKIIDTVKKERVICPNCGADNHDHYINIIINNEKEELVCIICDETFFYYTEDVPLYTMLRTDQYTRREI